MHKVPIEVLVHLALAGPRVGLAQPALAALKGQELQIQDGEGVRARSAVGEDDDQFREEGVRESVGEIEFRRMQHNNGKRLLPTHTRARECL